MPFSALGPSSLEVYWRRSRAAAASQREYGHESEVRWNSALTDFYQVDVCSAKVS